MAGGCPAIAVTLPQTSAVAQQDETRARICAISEADATRCLDQRTHWGDRRSLIWVNSLASLEVNRAWQPYPPGQQGEGSASLSAGRKFATHGGSVVSAPQNPFVRQGF
jgi:hypothetical protein